MIRLLIVDDEVASIKILQKFIPFEEKDLELVGIAENGSDALKFFHSCVPPQIVITDMNMPMMDGISFLQYLIDYHPEVKVLVISGYYDYKYTHAAIKANVYDYLLKPIDRNKLLAALESCCETICNEQKLNLTQKAPKIKIDMKLYQSILKIADRLLNMLEQGNQEKLGEELSSADAYIRSQTPDDALYYLVYKVLIESLFRYCVEKNYEDIASSLAEDIKIISWEKTWQTITDAYQQCLEQILEQRKLAATNVVVEQIYEYINRHYRENISLETIAESFFINKEYLTKIFRKRYDMTVGQYIIFLKIDDAKKQLIYSDHRIEAISESLGYTDPSYFQRQFKKEVGISPGRYRKMNT